MNKDFVPYAPSLVLEELRFNEPCLATIDQTEYVHIKGTKEPIRGSMMYFPIECPLYQQAFRWFREKYELHSYIEGAYPWFRFYINSNDDRVEGHKYLTFEEAELACLIKLIEIVKTK